MTQPIRRNRWWYLVFLVFVIRLGLAWRSPLFSLPKFAEKYGGDALWALLVYLGFAFLYARSPIRRLFLISLGFAWIIEFSQLYHAPWIDHLRAAFLGRLILGSTFNPPDLLAYLVGNILGALLELLHYGRKAETATAASRAD